VTHLSPQTSVAAIAGSAGCGFSPAFRREEGIQRRTDRLAHADVDR